MKENYPHLALIGIGAAAVLWYLLRQSSVTALEESPSNSAIEAGPVGFAPYPNVATIQPSSFDVGGSTINLSYNTFTPEQLAAMQGFAVGADGGEACGCGPSCAMDGKTPVTVGNVRESTFHAATDNLGGFLAKAGAPARFSAGAGGGYTGAATFAAKG